MLPIRVFADAPTYSEINGSYLYNYSIGAYSYTKCIKTNNNIRATVIRDGGQYTFYLYLISLSPFKYTSDNNSCSQYGPNVNAVAQSYNGNSFYGAYVSLGSAVNSYVQITSDIPCYYLQNGANTSTMMQYAYRLTYGDMNVEPEPEITYGDLINVGYNTKIAGSGDAAINNLDTITWNPEQDENGNDISDMSVTIRAVPGKYSAQSSQSILEQLYSNFVLDTLHVSELDTVNASNGSFSVTWNDVVHEFDLLGIPGFWFATKDTVKDPEGGYIKRGWIYQIRLVGEDYTGDWQTVYTATSSGVENDLTIVNSSTINQTLINSITEINNLNNTENNWYINNTTINMGEYSDPGSSGKPWWAYLLEAIVSLLNGVIDAIANLVGSIIDGLLGLFSFDSFSIPDFTANKQTIKQNSGIFGESIDLLQGINSTLSNADGTADPILYYPGLELMGEEFIPEITINLNTYVSDLGLTEWHNLAYVCTDAMIWISLIYTIYRKLIGVFKK